MYASKIISVLAIAAFTGVIAAPHPAPASSSLNPDTVFAMVKRGGCSSQFCDSEPCTDPAYPNCSPMYGVTFGNQPQQWSQCCS